MIAKPLRLLLGSVFILLFLGGCSNVRWKHPDPSEELLIRAMTELNGFHAYDDFGYEDNSLMTSGEAMNLLADTTKINENTPDFMFAEFKDGTISIIGYSKIYRPRSQNYRSPMIYRYVGELKRARYALPHMAPVVDGLIITSIPIEELKVMVLPLSSGRVVYPDFDGRLNFDSSDGRYTAISAFTSDDRDHIF